MARRIRSALVLVLLAVTECSAGAIQSREPTVIGWLGLFNRSLVQWLDQYCNDFPQGSREREECETKDPTPRVQLIQLRDGPSQTARPRGSLLLMAIPTRGLRSYFIPAAGGVGTPFQPDLFDADYGYGPYFHMTFLERRGTWFRLPQDPFLNQSWVNAADLGSDFEVKELQVEDIVTGSYGDLIILGIEQGVVRARPEQEADMWCDAEPVPPLKPWKELRIPFRDLYSPTGHLVVRIKYTRGC
jgi:hypothetical protein